MEDETEQQNIDQQHVEQLTKTPSPSQKAKVKDHKNIAAGKKLAEYNKKAKEQQKIVKENDDFKNRDENEKWLPETSFTSVIAILGLGLSTVDLFLRYKNQRSDEKLWIGRPPLPMKKKSLLVEWNKQSCLKENVIFKNVFTRK